MTFGEAFAAARAAGLPEFEYNGKRFTTDLAGETKKEVKPSQTRTLTPAPDYSLGDVEYRWGIDPSVRDDPLALLALNEIERLTGGDYGQVIKAVTRPDSPFVVDKNFIRDKYTKRGLNPTGKTSIYDTMTRGVYSPVTSKTNPTGLPQILVNTTDWIDKFGAKYDKRDVPDKDADDPSFFERLMRIIGMMDKPVLPKKSLSQLREEGSMPTVEDMDYLRRGQGTGLTTRHELDHFGFDVLRALGHDIKSKEPKYYQGDHEHEHYTDALDEESELGEKGLNYAELARKELIRRRGYAQGGIASIRKVA
tara:strand:- start:5542 stop:6465 length:924 start_codon:yes stop_codon:yes gene_type:complete